jgi:hypothetical protein
MDEPRLCQGCGEPLPIGSRPNRLHHNGRCRVAALRRRRREAQPVVPGLAPEIEAALERATSEARLVALIAQAASKGNWRAAAFILERRYPERWARRERPVIEPPPVTDDPFREIDELAARRRLHPDLRR